MTKLTKPVEFVCNLDQNVKNKILSNKNFKFFRNEIEQGLKDFLLTRNLIRFCNLNLERDYELIDWEKIVLLVNLEIEDFNEKLELWDSLDQVIRNKIFNLIDKTGNLRDKEIYKDFNRNFLIKFYPL